MVHRKADNDEGEFEAEQEIQQKKAAQLKKSQVRGQDGVLSISPNTYNQEELQSRLMEADDIRGKLNNNYLNLFGVERGKCETPACKKICPQYRGSYNIKSYSGIELFSCINCKCPMNSHEVPKKLQSFSNTLSEEMSNKYIESPHLNYKCNLEGGGGGCR